MQKHIKLSLVLVAFLSSLHAQSRDTIVLKPLDVISSAIKTDELKSTDAVEVYTSQDIQKAHVQNVYEFLNQQTSVIAMPSYGNPFTQKLDIHGYGIGDGYQNIVITLNGRKINNIDMVPQLLSSISPASISRIEIIKSSGIVVGGDGANAGVINITTKQNNDKELALYGGTYGSTDGSFYLGHSDDKISISASGEAQKNDGIRYIDKSGSKDKNKLATGTFNLTYTPIDALELRAGASFANTDVIYASYLSKDEYRSDPTQMGSTNWGSTHQTYDTHVVNLGASYFMGESLSINLDGAQEKKKSNYVTYDSKSDYDYDSLKINLDYESKFASLTLGVDMFNGLRHSHAGAWSIANDTTKDNLAGFIMGNFNFGDSSIKAGYRYEKVSYEFSDATKSNKDKHALNGVELGYNYALDEETSLFANYAHSYQAPDIDRFFNYGEFNGFIKPSISDSYTIGFNHITKTNKFKISAYYIDLKDEIYYYTDLSVPSWDPLNRSRNTNIDSSSKYGLDIYDRWLISEEWNLALNYNFVQATIDKEIGGNGENYAQNTLPGVSNHNAKATLSYLPNQDTTISLTQVYRSSAYAANDFANNFSQKQDAYNSTDVSATYTQEDWEIFAKINNLFNQKNGLWIEDDTIYPVNFTTTAIAGLKLKF